MFRALSLVAVASAVLLALSMVAGKTDAQVVVGGGISNGYNPYGIYDGGHASTAAEGYANGLGNVIQAAGSYNLQTSQAAINVEQARTQNINNQLLGTQTYFEMRKVNQAATKAEQIPGLTTEDTWRIAQANLPKRLTQMQLDPVTGKIYWPIEFQAPEYQKNCKQLEKLFIQRETTHGGIGYETYTQIQDVTNAMLADLNKNISKYKSGDYIRLQNFIQSLAYEAKFPAV